MLMRVKGVKSYISKGKLYCYHRKTGRHIKAAPGTKAFLAEVEFLDGMTIVRDPVIDGTLAGLISAYRASPEFQALAKETKRGYNRVFDWLAPLASIPVVQIDGEFVLNLRDKAFAKHKRRFANYVVQVIRLTMSWGNPPRKFITGNPAATVPLISRPKDARDVNRPWTGQECKVVLETAKGGMLRVVALGRYAAMRETDAVSFGWTGYDGQWVRWQQSKTGEWVELPAHHELRAILDATPRVYKVGRKGAQTDIHTSVVAIGDKRGRPLPFTVSGFRSSFFKMLRQLVAEGKIGAGLTFHGLRHTAGKALDEAGADSKTIAVMLGQKSIAMAQHYSKEGDKRRRAVDAVIKMERKPKGKLSNSAMVRQNGKTGRKSEAS